eukprot:3808837-Alexandrium_andersonii.AAC.1
MFQAVAFPARFRRFPVPSGAFAADSGASNALPAATSVLPLRRPPARSLGWPAWRLEVPGLP